MYRNGKRVMECILIRRKDNGKLALPGGFIAMGESVEEAAKRKFTEKALGGNPVSALRLLTRHLFAHVARKLLITWP